MDWQTLKAQAREKFRGACRVCPTCNGIACAGEVPGMGGLGTGAAFRNNVEALAGFRLNLRTIHNVHSPKLSCRILGIDLAMPVIAAAIGGIGFNMNGAMTEEDYAAAIVAGCRQAGTVGMTGDGPKPEVFEAGIKAMAAGHGPAIPIIKPRDAAKIVEMANRAAAAGAPAFGIDIDAAALINMTNAGQKVGPKTQDELAYIKRHTTIPFIVKGIMTPDEAEACCAAGVDAIVVSNHGGRALDHTPGTAQVLPYIAEMVKGKITILVDGGIRSGADILKMLALGADAVLIGRPLAIGAVGGGADGVATVLNKLAGELRAAMVLTGTADVAAVKEDIIW
ncbi:alpha-hydroxy-acid oxidizing protein [Sporolituus thermophilus]|uniref:L-lactate oxidase n=1 Tax=Sporolituus thermophilus DSM 23256 TaxID=1123285 RepID=A0A1G7MMC0_9FIRM|nr:alpha-hydroxy-acid oxidizing protein [Sporolituus thermophilus]SDF62824.1 FMN-dependent dehydrogenase, includes L-lactate dehydrogenase and type II isopentenyl diphosphate isomerase [Sporolituus thermophilus DSM 23256]